MAPQQDLVFCPTSILKEDGGLIMGWVEKQHICIYSRCNQDNAEVLIKEWRKVDPSKNNPLVRLGTVSARHSSHRSLIDSAQWNISATDYTLVLYPRDIVNGDFPHSHQIQAAINLWSRLNPNKTGSLETRLCPPLTAVSRAIFRSLMKCDGAWFPSEQLERSMTIFFGDIFLGFIFGLLIFTHANILSDAMCSAYKRYNEHLLPKAIQWLMGYPAGLKLNSNLSKFIGELYLWLLGLWVELFNLHINQHLPKIVRVVGISGVLGFRVLSANSFLLLRALLINSDLYYLLAARLFSAESTILGSLWRLFRGKKWNVLHSRLDSADYSLDQLLLGTVIFTTMIFLLPTVLVYYILFAVAEVVRISILASFNACLVLIDLPSVTLPDPIVVLETISPESPPTFQLRKKGNLLTGFFKSVSRSWGAVGRHHYGPSFLWRIMTGGSRVRGRKSE